MTSGYINSFLHGNNNPFEKRKINVVSLFNGMGTLRQAFSDLNIEVENYYSSEIKPYAIELQQHHFSDVIQVGDINNWKKWDIDWKTIDFIGSGSPCQDLSIAGKRAGINGKESSLFWVFVEILNYVKDLNPNVVFLQENVGSASKLDIGIMSRALGIYPVRINSKLLTAQLRDRYYWTNIKTKNTFFDIVTDIPQPKDCRIMFKDIVTDGIVDREKATAILESESRICTSQNSIKKRSEKDFINVIYTNNDIKKTTVKKRVCVRKHEVDVENLKLLLGSAKKNSNLSISIIAEKLNVKKTTAEHWFRKDNCFAIPDKDVWLKLKELLNITNKHHDKAITEFIKKDNEFDQSNRVYHIDGKMPTMTESCKETNITDGHTVRTLNKVEMCRLQGFSDNYCDILTKNKAASLLGDGWTLPVIIHILSFLLPNRITNVKTYKKTIKNY